MVICPSGRRDLTQMFVPSGVNPTVRTSASKTHRTRHSSGSRNARSRSVPTGCRRARHVREEPDKPAVGGNGRVELGALEVCQSCVLGADEQRLEPRCRVGAGPRHQHDGHRTRRHQDRGIQPDATPRPTDCRTIGDAAVSADSPAAPSAHASDRQPSRAWTGNDRPALFRSLLDRHDELGREVTPVICERRRRTR